MRCLIIYTHKLSLERKYYKVLFVPIPVNTIFSSAYLQCPKRIKVLYSLAKFMPSSLYTNNPSRVDANKTHLLHLYSDGNPILCSEPLCFDAMCH